MFAFVQVPNVDGSVSQAWLPAIVVVRLLFSVFVSKPHSDVFDPLFQSKRSETTQVHILAGPLRGQNVPAPHILPYNPETAEAIRKTGQIAYWEKGTN